MRRGWTGLALAALLAGCDGSGGSGDAGAESESGALSIEIPKGKATYHFGGSDSQTTIRFDSRTSVTNILGKSTRVEGDASIDWDAGTGACSLKVPAISLRTGMDDRDRAVLGKGWLDSAAHPHLGFSCGKATRVSTFAWKLEGEFMMKGVRRPLTIDAEVKPVPDELAELLGPGRWVRVKTAFKIRFTDFGMTLTPQYQGVVEEEWSVAVQVFGSTEKPGATASIENPLEVDAVRPMPRIKPVDEAGIEGRKFKFGKKPQLSTLTATSETALETVTLQTYGVAGVLGLDEAGASGKVRIRIPVAYLRSGVESRDVELQGPGWLDMKRNPDLLFESTKAVRKGPAAWSVDGIFTMNGVSRPISFEVETWELSREAVKASKWGDVPGLGFRGEFKTRLSEHGIKLDPKSLGKLNDVWTIRFNLVGLLEE